MIYMKALVVALAFAATAWMPSQAQIKNAGQIGVVVTAFDGERGLSVAFGLRTLLRAGLSGQDPETGKTGYGRGIAYYVPAPMSGADHQTAVDLAQSNGMQAVLWGQSTQLFDGIAYSSFLSISDEYEDFRMVRPELWSVSVDGVRIALGPPRSFVAFPPSVFPENDLQKLGSPGALEHCPLDGGACEHFDDYDVFRAIEIRNNGIIVDRAGRKYFVDLAPKARIDSAPVDYTSAFIAYARGNFNDAVKKSRKLTSEALPIDLRIDGLLYQSLSLAQMERYDDARRAVQDARDLAPSMARSLRVAVMIEIASSGGWNKRAEDLWEIFDKNYLPQIPVDLQFNELRSSAQHQAE